MLEKSKNYIYDYRKYLLDTGITMTGKIEKILEGKTFGFIKYNGEDYFFHRDDFNGHWQDLVYDVIKGEITVIFDIVSSNRGLRASNVRRVDYPNQSV